jgi:TatD DNase family protein
MIFGTHPKLPGAGQLIDTHCHLNDEAFDLDRAEVVTAAQAAGVGLIVDVGIDVASSLKVVENARKFRAVAACVGIDPQIAVVGEYFDARFENEAFRAEQMQQIENLIEDNRDLVIMIGETGIDDYWLEIMVDEGKITAGQREASLRVQEDLFRRHLELAVRYDLPLSVHSRGAEGRCLEIGREYPAARGIFHSYTAGADLAKKIIAAGWGLGVNGIVTYKSAEPLRELYVQLLVGADLAEPQDLYERGIYLETDAPYLTPAGKRQPKRNSPALLPDILLALYNKVSSM